MDVAEMIDPFATLSRRQRWSMRRGLRRAWHRGLSARDKEVVEALNQRSGSMPLSHVRIDHVGSIKVTEIGFFDGCLVRLGFCHPGTVGRLIESTASGLVTLERAARHGDFLGLYFLTPAGLLPVLAGAARLGGVDGGLGDGHIPEFTAPRGGLALSSS
jgi:hypothetical protein